MASALSSFKMDKYAGHEPLSFNDSHGARPSPKSLHRNKVYLQDMMIWKVSLKH